MADQISLRALYNHTIKRFPQYTHSPDRFQGAILEVLNRDPIRTSSTRKEISQVGLEFQLPGYIPNDFLNGVHDYLESIGVPNSQRRSFHPRDLGE